MAITLVDSPYEYTAIKQKLIFTATSSQVGQPGFRFVAVVTAASAGVTTTQNIYIQPNLNGAMVLDINPVVKDLINIGITASSSPTVFDNSLSAVDYYDQNNNIIDLIVDLYDGYEVLGVFTVNPLGLPFVRTRLSLINAAFEISQGFNPDPDLIFALSGPTAYELTDLNPDVYDLSTEITTYSLGANTIGIKARFSEDYGCITIPTDDGARLPSNAIDQIQVIQFNSAGAPIQTDTAGIAVVEGTLAHLGIYPANIDGAFGLAANTHHYIVNFTSAGSPCARSIAFFRAEDECRFDTYRLAWINSRGGWDYWNFTKRSEENYSIERKRYRKVIGNYATANANFSFNTYDRGLTERGAFVEKMLNVSTDYLSEAQFEFLKGLSYSDSVYILDGPTPIPVVVENTNFSVIRNRSYIKEGTQLTVNLKFSQEYNV